MGDISGKVKMGGYVIVFSFFCFLNGVCLNGCGNTGLALADEYS